ncbi:MAG: D-sedoheptulose 7-phosphate isomerase [Candidatus Brocadiae bacterium]|nr:D-sedoheptulose 7-phosphate isomerase [Candidatus Brocadiia bacterium]
MKERIKAILRETISVHEGLIELGPLIEKVGRSLAEVFAAGGSVYVMGNGGSAADAQHLAGEMVGRFLMERAPLPCHALTTDTSVLTAVANDYGFDSVFARQVDAFARQGDAVIGISTTGNSANVNAGVEQAKKRGALTVGLTGGSGGRLAEICDVAIVVPVNQTPRVQEAHGTIIHILCDLVEQAMFGQTIQDTPPGRHDAPAQ